MECKRFRQLTTRFVPSTFTPDDDFEDDAADMQWREYCRIASTLDRARILEVVLSDLDADDSPLYEFIDSLFATHMNPVGLKNRSRSWRGSGSPSSTSLPRRSTIRSISAWRAGGAP